MRALCAMPTFGRLRFIPTSIACFLKQTYKNKHLVIVNDDVNVVIKVDHPQISVINLPLRTPTTMKRNIASDFIEHDICFPWDDDDISLPNRLQNHIHFHQLVKRDYVLNKSYIVRYGGIYDIVEGVLIHAGSFKKEPFLNGGRYQKTPATDDQWLYHHCLKTHYEYSDNNYIDYCYMWSGLNYHYSCHTSDIITLKAREERESLNIRTGQIYHIEPDYYRYNHEMEKISNILDKNNLKIGYL